MSEMVDRVRRALGEPHSFRAGDDELSPSDIDEILRRLAAAGLVIVPREPTEAMEVAGAANPGELMHLCDRWRAMIDAALID